MELESMQRVQNIPRLKLPPEKKLIYLLKTAATLTIDRQMRI